MSRTLAEVLREVDSAVGRSFDSGVRSVTSERSDGETALHVVAKWGDADAIKILVLAGATLSKPGEDGNTPLHYAAMMGHMSAAVALVELGAKSMRDRYGNTPAQLAEEHPHVREYLLAHGF